MPVEGNPYRVWLVSNLSATHGVKKPIDPAQIRNLQIIASLEGYPIPTD